MINKILSNINYYSILNGAMCIWGTTIFFPEFQSVFYVVFTVLFYGVVRGYLDFSFSYKQSVSFKTTNTSCDVENQGISTSFWKSQKTPFYFLLAYLLWMTTTIFWSDDIREYFRQFEKLIPLYLLCIIGFIDKTNKHVNISKVMNAFLWGGVLCIGYIIIRMGVDLFVGETIGRVKSAGIMSFDILTYVNHRAYLGVSLLMMIPILIQGLPKLSGRSFIITILSVLFIYLLCIMSGARVLMLLTLLLTGYSIYYVYGGNLKWYVQLTSVVLIVLGVVLISKNQRVQSKISMLKAGEAIEKVESRVYIWATAYELIKKEPLTGYGMGDVKKQLQLAYKVKGYKIAEAKELNAHNQYLQVCLQGGMIGTLLLVSFFLSLLICNRKNSLYNTSLILIVSVFFLFEAVLVRNIGVFPLLIFVWFFNCFAGNRYNSRREFATISVFVVFVIILICSLFIPFKAEYPRTWMTGDYKVVKNSYIPLNTSIPSNSNVAVVDFSSIRNSSDKYYSFYYLFRGRDYSNDQGKVSIWCYVPSSKGITRVHLICSINGNQCVSAYDFNKVGTWQELSIEKIEGANGVSAFTFIGLNKNSNMEKGKVFFAYPKFN